MNAKELCDWFAGPSPISEMDAEDKHTIIRALRLLAAIEDESVPTPETDAAFAGYVDAENRTAFMAEACNKMGKIEQERNAALRALQMARYALAEIREEWAGAECGEPVTAQEGYAIGLVKRMYQLAVEGLK